MAAVLAAGLARAHEVVDFAGEVKPILDRSCGGLGCHLGERTSGVELTTWEDVVGSIGEQYGGPIVLPGKASVSPLIDKISRAEPLFGLREPRVGEPLADAEIALITRWVDEGARRTHHLTHGDADGSDRIDISDAVRILLHLFQGGAAARCDALADADANGKIEVTDAVVVLGYLFLGEAAPAELSAGEEEACRRASELSFASIYDKVLARSCAFVSCHSAISRKGGLSFATREESHRQLVGAPPQNEAALAAKLLRVDAGRPENSFLLKKITVPGPGEGNKMPSNSSIGLSDAVVAAVREWILAGAPLEGSLAGVPDITEEPLPPFDRIPVPPAPENGIQIHLQPFAIGPRSEREIFYYIDRPFAALAADPVIERIDVHMSDDSHHFILYEWTGATKPPAGVRNIGSVGDIINNRKFMLGAQQPFFSLKFPAEVGLRISRNASFDLNSHYLNLHGTEVLYGEVYINFHFADPGAAVSTFVQPVFDINPFINVPPHQSRTITAVFPMASGGKVPAGREYHIYSLSSHMHRHGDRFKVFLVNNLQQLNPPQVVYDNLDWDDPLYKVFDEPLALKATQGLRFDVTHTYDDPPSDSSPPLTFGLTSEDEMAILLGYYAVK
ncbi:MAG: hypothetical protein ACRD2T_16010 [Thermoanaerobaculia bacterium]